MPYLVDGHRILFTNVPKTGGNWTRSAIGLAKVYGSHGPPSEAAWLIPTHEVVAQIRDPWSWYASLYGHLDAMGQHRALAQWGNGDLSFDAVLRGWTRPETVEVIPDPPGVVWSPYGPGPPPELAGGLWSWTYRAFLGELPAWLIDLAQVANGWSLLLDRPPSSHPPSNARATGSAHRDRYTRALKDRVRSADRELIDRCGYQFLKAARAGPLIPWAR